jgi:hypothetical protein
MPIDYDPAKWRSGTKELRRQWTEYINGIVGSTTKGYKHSKYSSICLPVLANGSWVLLVCDMENRCYSRVVFNNWEYKVDGDILNLGEKMKFMALEIGLKSVAPKQIESKVDWASKAEHPRPDLYFSSNRNKRIKGVQGQDRLIALLSDLAASNLTVRESINNFNKRNKADSRVLERVRIVQAMFLAAETGRGPLVDQARNLYKQPVVHVNSQDNQIQEE